MLQVADNEIQVLLAEEYEHPRYEEVINKILDIIRGLNYANVVHKDILSDVKIYVDASLPELISSLKRVVRETSRWEYINDIFQEK